MQDKCLNFQLNKHQLKKLLDWKHKVEEETGEKLNGIHISFTYFENCGHQIICRPAEESDLKLKNIPKIDGTYDKFRAFEEVIHEYDDIGFSSTSLDILGHRYTLLFICWKYPYESNNEIKCFLRINDMGGRLTPIAIGDNPHIIKTDPYILLFGKPSIRIIDWSIITSFIVKHKDAIISHWNGITDSMEFLDEISNTI